MAYVKDPEVLSEQEKRFCQAVLMTPNLSEAARMAEYAKDNAGRAAQRLMKRPRILKEIERLRSERNERLDITKDALVVRISDLSYRAENAKDFKTAGHLLLELLKHVAGRRLPGEETDPAASAEDPTEMSREATAQVFDLAANRRAALRQRKAEEK